MTAPDIQPRPKDRLSTDFDAADFCERHGLTRSALAEPLDVPVQTVYQWAARKLWPLSAYKAVVAHFAPDDAERCELRQVVGSQRMPFTVTQSILDLAAKYDVLRAGGRIAYASGEGYYTVPAVDTAPLTLIPDDQDPIADQDVLLQIITRIMLDRNNQAIEISKLKQAMIDRDAQIQGYKERVKQLQASIKEWEQLADRATSPVPTPPDMEARVAERVVTMLKSKGLASLSGELARINPQAGHRH